MEQEILTKLQDHEWFRERRQRTKGYAILLQRKYHLEGVPLKVIQEIIDDGQSMDRYWRKHTKNYPALRGQDYEDKKKYAQKKQIDLGYEGGFNQLSNVQI